MTAIPAANTPQRGNLSQKVTQALKNRQPISFKAYRLSKKEEQNMLKLLEFFLMYVGYGELYEQFAYCLRELAVNAKKANTKRVYFQKKNLNIYSLDDYKKGIKDFKEDTLSDIESYLDIQKEQGLYIRVRFYADEDHLELSVHNNAPLTPPEERNIQKKLEAARQFFTLEEALTQVSDPTEGAGLGIVILVMMLRNIGVPDECISIQPEDDETVARIKVPKIDLERRNIFLLSQEIAAAIERLPPYPEHILELQELLQNRDVDLQIVSRKITSDPYLTANILKTVNSPVFMQLHRVESIFEAVKLIGLERLNNLIYTFGTEKMYHDTQKEVLWKHSFRTGFIGARLVQKLKLSQDLYDTSYIGGVIHDIGKIPFPALIGEPKERIDQFCRQKSIPEDLLDDILAGGNHEEIGSMLAKRWNFPDAFIDIIKYHHEPQKAPPRSRPVVYVVHLANILAQNAAPRVDLLNPVIRQFSKIKDQDSLDTLYESLNREFDAENAP